MKPLRFAVAPVVSVVLVATATPALAGDTWSTTTVALPDSTVIDFGDVIDITVDIDSQSGAQPTRGTATLYAMEAETQTWTLVQTNASALLDFDDVKPRMTTAYKVVYDGYRAGSAQDDTYEASESTAFTVEVARTITHPSGGFELKGRVKPRYGKKKIVIKASRSQTSGYVKYTTIRTDRRGRYSVTLPRRKGTWYWYVNVKGDARYLPTGYQWETWVS